MTSETNEDSYLAGSASADITPWLGIQLAGTIGVYRPTRLIVDSIEAQVLVLQLGEKRVCLASLDLPWVTAKWSNIIRESAESRFGIDPDALVIHATQNHGAPTLGLGLIPEDDSPYLEHIPPEFWWFRAGDERYFPVVIERVLNAIGQAIENLEPVSIGSGRGIEGRVAFNRRYRMRDGTTRTHPPIGDPNILYREGPMDPELGVLYIANRDAQAVSMLLHHTCHPCHFNVDYYLASAGWPGAWRRNVQKLHGPQCNPLVINGYCGNIHHRNHLSKHHVDNHLRIGDLLTETTQKVMKTIKFQEEPLLDYRSTTIQLPLRSQSEESLAEAQAMLDKHPTPQVIQVEDREEISWAWAYAISRLDLERRRQRNPLYDYEIQAFRIGDTALIASGGEPFVEGQLDIKLNSPAPKTFIAHMSNTCAGYIPTAEALEAGGYETDTSNHSQFAPEALDMIVEGALGLLHELFLKDQRS